MPTYKAPVRDMRFLMNEVLDFESHYKTFPEGEEATPDMVEAIIGEMAKLCENTLAPLYQSGDEEGCKFENGVVTTPKGYKEAYDEFVAGGWQGLSHPVEFGGQGLPASLGLIKSEMMATANWSFTMYPGLSMGAMNTIQMHGSDQQLQDYLVPLTEGRWGGTMCLTEPQCGTDLGQVKTKAEPQKDGSYKISGTKIFISSGEHDLTENIVHIVLARLPDAPKGTRGISLFIVPKYLPGKIGEDNGVHCGSLEKKMGIKASATCVMNFDEATGFLIGPENKGLECMFTFMNTARIGTSIQGLAHAELSYQGALTYAKERKSMRALSGKKEPDAIADSLIHHGDVRRMLLKQKAIAEGGRAMIYFAAQYADKMISAAQADNDEEYQKWDDELGFLTPILKGFLTEKGLEVANDGMQVFGGHGYIKEHGMEQIVRDARISTLYEGTTGIQALDLLGRKVLLLTKGKCVRDFSKKLVDFGTKNLRDPKLRPFAWKLLKIAAEWNYLTTRIMLVAAKDRDIVSTASYDFLMYSGYAMMAYFWALQAGVAKDKLENGGNEPAEFYQAKLATAEFYFDRMLPSAKAHADAALKPTKSTMQLKPEHFSFDYE
ncbi:MULTISPECIES: acyl-CoA dehydrogenase C-terminal domain-containing protein [unclassified Alcanivorax]|jgi:alkylation response protein AidB-like acyl-CoA dehydrogenase|uniref:acyl-CoA dehydrogenase C-terminal domain-containing protein n=2 Tax=Alcanivorax TaxID=59753 RepID=UPI0007B791C3|nr:MULTISPECIES: acyl-CoA dehydrogenase C-terminal domain-containing protein [unclassified Alcanivorax]KZX74535.1 acyl-CoA dehydrogenase [Alcanivorax sp. HI0011]KZX80965.1 acyl-CoA dehydrogenase [Alcanivorax sp. HI0013]KZY22410.1 acyl-CoA dehydrogenase [Alcanivorax sp. HI0035]MEE3389494.1 acyl-CoA dehydrogenase C-terminal domain-containing protein [Pseudomonadota bacterium]KZX67581.1 acyl-CoA dehydrogenase [Alcanivorax sp. HI0003]